MPIGPSMNNSLAPRPPPIWAACSKISASATSPPAPRKPRAASSGYGPRCRTGSSANSACARSPRSTPPKRTCPSSSPISIACLASGRPPRELALLLSCRYRRVVARDNTIRLGPRWVQLRARRSYAGLTVDVRELLDGRLIVLHDDVVRAEQPSPGLTFILKPRRSPSQDRRPPRAPTPRRLPQRLPRLAPNTHTGR